VLATALYKGAHSATGTGSGKKSIKALYLTDNSGENFLGFVPLHFSFNL
jgi:hypothetical protein